MANKLYDSENCPCPTVCKRHGKCQGCREAHRASGSQTYCEKLADSGQQQADHAFEYG